MALKVLMVDDNQTFTAAVKLMLDLVPDVTIVGQASSGQQALALAEATQPDLMLLDISMPGMNGLEVALQLQTAAHRPQIVFLSACETGAYSDVASQLGAVACVDKADLVLVLLPIIEHMAAGRPSEEVAC